MRNIDGIKRKFESLAPDLTTTEVANALLVSHNTAREWAVVAGYKTKDGRFKECWQGAHPGGHSKADWAKADWSQEDSVIAAALGVSRCRVWQKRKELAKTMPEPKPPFLPTTADVTTP